VVALTMILIERIQFHLPEMKITIPPAEILEFKEALIFALLAC
jgi:anhydro-N-acetylmuramic acid kinase